MKVIDYIKLCRPINLLIIAATMLLSRYFIIWPFFRLNGLDLIQSLLVFLALIVSIVCIAVFGYFINDINDLKSDEINKKLRPLVRFPKEKERVQNIAYVLLFVGLFIGLIAWYLAGNWMLIIIHCFAAASLYFYSKYLQGTLLVGNLSAAFLCAVLPIIVFVFDMPSLIEMYYTDHPVYFLENGDKTYSEKFFKLVLKFITAFAAFIFLISMQREIVKDIEDYDGDSKVGMRTLPIRMGVNFAIKLSVFIGVILLILFSWFLIIQINWLFTINQFLLFACIAFFLFGLPLFQAMYLTYKYKFNKASKMLKISMIGGLIFWIAFGIIY